MTPETAELVLVLQLHTARKRARAAAEAEVVTLLEGLGARRLPGGPLADMSGVAWVGVKKASLDVLRGRLRQVGYSTLIRVAEPLEAIGGEEPTWARARWKGGDYVLRPVFSESRSELQRDAPDRRGFLLECGDGEVRRIVGYRGGRGPLEHRALPVYDARLVVNLLGPPAGGVMLDPFAGAGSIPLFARRAGWRTIALDRDRTLRFGLAELATGSVVGDASELPLLPGRIDAAAAEPPYRDDALPLVTDAVRAIARVLKPGGRLVLLVASTHADALLAAGSNARLEVDLDLAIDRRGLSVRCLRMLAPTD
jgi:SAM-dependent methyltransferase